MKWLKTLFNFSGPSCQDGDFGEGQKVYHCKHGVGVIREINPFGGSDIERYRDNNHYRVEFKSMPRMRVTIFETDLKPVW